MTAPDGTVRRLTPGQVDIRPLGQWRSPHTGVRYPADWRLRIAALRLDAVIVPYLADQEVNVSLTYGEGASRVNGTRAGRTVTGSGYVELTGYT